MEENKETGKTENEPKVIIIGHVDHGKTTLSAAIKAMDIHKGEIIIVNSIEEAKDNLGVDIANIPKENPFDNTPIMYIKNYRGLEPLKEPYIDFSQNNPWPSPKGRKGKRKW